MAAEFEINHSFDQKAKRHYINGKCTVLHCHHYATLYSQLADVATLFDGKRILVDSAEDSFYELLNDYFAEKNISESTDRITVAEDYWKTVGMGLIQFTGVGKFTVTAEMDYSHVDEGWLQKWGGRDKPVNFITCGFVAAVSALVNNRPPKSYTVNETKSLVCGDELSVFKAVLQ